MSERATLHIQRANRRLGPSYLRTQLGAPQVAIELPGWGDTPRGSIYVTGIKELPPNCKLPVTLPKNKRRLGAASLVRATCRVQQVYDLQSKHTMNETSSQDALARRRLIIGSMSWLDASILPLDVRPRCNGALLYRLDVKARRRLDVEARRRGST